MAFSLSGNGWESPSCPVCPSFNQDGSIDPALTTGTILLIDANNHAYGNNTVINNVTGKVISTATPTSSQNATTICGSAQWDGGHNTYLNAVGITSFGKKVLCASSEQPLYLNSFDNFKPAANEAFTIDFRFGCVSHTMLGTWAFGRSRITPAPAVSGWVKISGVYSLNSGHKLTCIVDGTTLTVTMGFLTVNTMHHVALTRDDAGVIRLFANGALVGSTTNANALTDNLNIDNNSRFKFTTNEPYGAAISEIRFIRGSAAWTANFTPPTASYT